VSATVLSFQGIHKSYGSHKAVRDVSFDVRQGEVFGLLGPNGAGKTTLIRILMDVIRADAGTVDLFGRPLDREELDRIGYLPEERGLYKKQKVQEVLAYFGELKGLAHADAKKRGLAWLDKVGLPETAAWKVERLSKGMAQKVQIAATLMFEPPLAILDEPFSGLDPLNVRLVQDIIFDRARAGRTTILSTHQMNMVETLCDRVALINKGQLMVYGEVDEVRTRWSQPEVRVATGGVEPPDVAGVTARRLEEAGTWRLMLAAGATPAAVLRQLVAAGAPVERFEKVLAPMEEVFINVVQGVQHDEPALAEGVSR
jgi:ABC-2 type transport system ATP-binding protein